VEIAILPEDLSVSSAAGQNVAAGVGAEALAKAGVVRRQRGAMEKVVKVVLEGASLLS